MVECLHLHLHSRWVSSGRFVHIVNVHMFMKSSCSNTVFLLIGDQEVLRSGSSMTMISFWNVIASAVLIISLVATDIH